MGAIQQVMLGLGSSVPAFSPASIAGLDWWLKGDDATISGVPEFDWPDRSGANRPYGQNTVARQPTLVAGPNGHQLVRFGTNKCLVPDPTARTLATANTLICVCSPTSLAAEYILKGSGSEGRPGFISGFNPGGGVKNFEYWNRQSGTGERETFDASATGLHILTITRTDDTGTANGEFDGVSVFSPAVNTARDWNTLTISIIGALTAGSSTYDGDIGEILHWPSILSGPNLTLVHNYLKADWNI
jgi:hypothetical protein